MRRLILPLLFLISFLSGAQNEQKEINEQVWIPFTKAIMNQDAKSFILLHSKDLIRAERDSKKVLTYSEYEKRMLESWPKWKASIVQNKTTYLFELRFTERIGNSTQAFEVGYFKNESVSASGEKEVSYGKFQVALRKENAVWKILVDSDTSEGDPISEKDFLAAKPLER